MDIQHFQSFTTIDVGRISGGLSCGIMECRGERFRFVLQRHFYFGFVIHGTASLADMKRSYAIEEADIFVLTPSMTACIEATDENCRISCIRMSPDFFDTLCDGQPAYNQLARFFSEARLPIVRLEAGQCEYLKKTVALFSERLDAFALNQEGIIRHLCSFYLLQVANALYQEGQAAHHPHLPVADGKSRNRTDRPLNHIRTHLCGCRETSGMHGHGHQGNCRDIGLRRPVVFRKILSETGRRVALEVPHKKAASLNVSVIAKNCLPLRRKQMHKPPNS